MSKAYSKAYLDFSNFANFARQYHKNTTSQVVSRMMKRTLNEEGTMLKKTVIERTPVGVYQDHWVEFTTKGGKHVKFWASYHGKQGGTLQKGWKKSRVKHSGNTYKQDVYNNVYYAKHVEWGHRTRNGGRVRGRFMLRASVSEVGQRMPIRINAKFREYLRKVMMLNE